MHVVHEDMSTADETLRRNLIAALAARDWSQSELSRRSGIGQSTISRIISGKPQGAGPPRGSAWATVVSLAAALDIDPRELAGGEPEVANDEPPPTGVVVARDLISAYVSSRWFLRDRPTPEELQWLADYGEITWTGDEPGPGVLSALLRRRRGR